MRLPTITARDLTQDEIREMTKPEHRRWLTGTEDERALFCDGMEPLVIYADGSAPYDGNDCERVARAAIEWGVEAFCKQPQLVAALDFLLSKHQTPQSGSAEIAAAARIRETMGLP